MQAHQAQLDGHPTPMPLGRVRLLRLAPFKPLSPRAPRRPLASQPGLRWAGRRRRRSPQGWETM